jgi:VanZ family protein
MAPRYWVPVALWMALMFVLSTDEGSSQHTGRLIEPVIRWVLPHAAAHTVAGIHTAIRKLAHVTEYAVLVALWFRALHRGAARSPAASAALALVIAVTWAALDEWHQRFVPSRTPSVADVGVDALGGVVGAALQRLWVRRTRPAWPAEG